MRQKVILLLALPAMGVLICALLIAFDVQRSAALPAAFVVLAGVGLITSLLGPRVLHELASTAAELRQLREAKAPDKPKRARGRRDAFNEILLGLEARAEEVQRDRDNLEQLVTQRTLALQRRNEAMRLVLDNVEQGLVTIELDGSFSSERSRVFDEWFRSAPGSVTSFLERLSAHDHGARAMLSMCWAQVVDGMLPLELSLDQMPKRLEADGRHYALDYRPILELEKLRGVLLVVTDITEQMERVHRDAQQRELIAVFERIMRDRSGFLEFFQECDALVRAATDPALTSVAQMTHVIHTLKGNCGCFGVTSMVDVAHWLEGVIAERGGLPERAELAKLADAWRVLADRLRKMAGSADESVVAVATEEIEQLIEAMRHETPYAELARRMRWFRHERVAPRLRRSSEQAQAIARRLGKGALDVQVSVADHVRFSAEQGAPFWAAFVHVIRNAVDHGIEPPQERLAAGKPESGNVRLSAWTDARNLFIEVADDGRGIDWERVRESARERGLPHQTEAELTDALFADGLSTAKRLTDISGRGLGMGAVREATAALDGKVHVRSKAGEGTTFQFIFPLATRSPGAGIGESSASPTQPFEALGQTA